MLNTESEIKEVEEPVKELKNGSVRFNHVSFCYPGSTEKNLKGYKLRYKIWRGHWDHWFYRFIQIYASTIDTKTL